MLLKTPRSRNVIPDKLLKDTSKSGKQPQQTKESRFSFLTKPLQLFPLEKPTIKTEISKKEKSTSQPLSQSTVCKVTNVNLMGDYQTFSNSSVRKDGIKNLPYATRTLRAFKVRNNGSARKDLVMSSLTDTKEEEHQFKVNEIYYGIQQPRNESQKIQKDTDKIQYENYFQQQVIESDYIHNIHKVGKEHRNSFNNRSSKMKRPIVKVEMDLENNSLLLIQAVPRRKSQKRNLVDRSILKRSLSQSAKVLTSKASQLRDEPVYFSPKPDKMKPTAALKVVELKI